MNMRYMLIAAAAALLLLCGCRGRADMTIDETRISAAGDVFFSMEVPLGSMEELIVKEVSDDTLTLVHYYYGWSAFGGGWIENKWPGAPIVYQVNDKAPLAFDQYRFEILDIANGKVAYRRIR